MSKRMSTDPEPDTEQDADDERDGILSPLIGHDGAKAILRSALRRGDIHLHLTGPSGSGKSVALLAIEEVVPGAEYVEARGLSERELRETLKKDPSLLLIDEFDNMTADAYKALNTPMEQGRVTKKVQGDKYDVEIDTQVLAASNEPEKIPGDVQDRFVTVEFHPYTREEFIEVCGHLLPEQVDWVGAQADPMATGEHIGQIVWDKTDSRSPRKARDAARLASEPGRVAPIVRAMNDAKADVDSDPVTLGDLPHSQSAGGSRAATQTTTTLDDIRNDMVDPDEIQTRDSDEVGSLFGDGSDSDSDDGDSDSDSTVERDSSPITPSNADGSDGALIPDSGVDGVDMDEVDSGDDDGFEVKDTDTTEAALNYIDQMVEEDQQVLPNSYEMPGVSIVVPSTIAPETFELVKQHNVYPSGSKSIPSPASALESLPEEIVDGLTAFQFIFDDPEDMASCGYDLDGIVSGLEGERFLITKSSPIEWEPSL